MNNKPEKLVVIVQESVIGSIIKDSVTFLMMGGLMYFNHMVLDGNGWIDFMFILFSIIFLSPESSVRVFTGTKSNAIKWLETK